MASQTSPIYDIQVQGTSAAIGLENPVNAMNGRLRQIVVIHTTTSALTAGTDTLTLCKLPANARVVSLELIVPASVGTSSAKIGNATNSTLYGSGVDLSTAGRKQFVLTAATIGSITSGQLTLPAAGGNPSSAEETIILAPVTVNFATAITFAALIWYAVD